MKRKTRIVLSLILLVLGGILLLLPTLSDQLIKQEASNALRVFEEINTPDLQENAKRSVEFDFDAISSLNVQNTIQSSIFGSAELIEKNKQDIIGQLIIEDIDVNLVLFNGLTDEKLLVGVSTMKANQVMGQGNYAIAGHYTPGHGVLFNLLPEIKNGAVVKLTDKETVYEYVIYKTEKVPATAIHFIEDQVSVDRGKPTISLMSCYYSGNTDVRWFAFGELLRSYPYVK